MSGPEFSIEQKLAALEHVIEKYRWTRAYQDTTEYQIHQILKSVARDLRAAAPEAPLGTLVSLAHRIDAAKRQKARLGFIEIGSLQGIGEEVLGCWPVIKRVLGSNQR